MAYLQDGGDGKGIEKCRGEHEGRVALASVSQHAESTTNALSQASTRSRGMLILASPIWSIQT